MADGIRRWITPLLLSEEAQMNPEAMLAGMLRHAVAHSKPAITLGSIRASRTTETISCASAPDANPMSATHSTAAGNS